MLWFDKILTLDLLFFYDLLRLWNTEFKNLDVMTDLALNASRLGTVLAEAGESSLVFACWISKGFPKTSIWSRERVWNDAGKDWTLLEDIVRVLGDWSNIKYFLNLQRMLKNDTHLKFFSLNIVLGRLLIWLWSSFSVWRLDILEMHFGK